MPSIGSVESTFEGKILIIDTVFQNKLNIKNKRCEIRRKNFEKLVLGL